MKPNRCEDRFRGGIFDDARVQTLLTVLKELSDVLVCKLYEQAYESVRRNQSRSLHEAAGALSARIKDWGYEKQRESANEVLRANGPQVGDLYLKSLELYLTQILVKERRARGRRVVSGVPPFESFLHHFYSKLLDTMEVRDLTYRAANVSDRLLLVQNCLLATFYDYVPQLNVTEVVDSPRVSERGEDRYNFNSPSPPRKRAEPVADFFSPKHARFPSARSNRPELPKDDIPSISQIAAPKPLLAKTSPERATDLGTSNGGGSKPFPTTNSSTQKTPPTPVQPEKPSSKVVPPPSPAKPVAIDPAPDAPASGSKPVSSSSAGTPKTGESKTAVSSQQTKTPPCSKDANPTGVASSANKTSPNSASQGTVAVQVTSPRVSQEKPKERISTGSQIFNKATEILVVSAPKNEQDTKG